MSTGRDRLKVLGYDSYWAYLKSEHWAEVKRQYTELHQPLVCSRCPATRVQFHHLTYERLGEEWLSDIEPLCRKCHAEEHGKPERPERVPKPKVIKEKRTKKGKPFKHIYLKSQGNGPRPPLRKPSERKAPAPSRLRQGMDRRTAATLVKVIRKWAKTPYTAVGTQVSP